MVWSCDQFCDKYIHKKKLAWVHLDIFGENIYGFFETGDFTSSEVEHGSLEAYNFSKS